MKKFFVNYFFMICSSLFLLHQIVEKILEIHYSLLDNYLDNFLCFPILLTLFLAERSIFTKNKHYKLSILEIATITIVLSIFFEQIVPKYFQAFTKDYLDYLAYFLGSIMFFFHQKKINQA